MPIPRPFLSAPDSHLRDGSIVVQKGQVGYLSDLKRQPTFHPMDLPPHANHTPESLCGNP